MKKRLEIRLDDPLNDRIDRFAEHCECNKSDVVRAAITLGLTKLLSDASLTGLDIKSWIAALNGKVK